MPNHRSIPKDATFPANRAPALPRFDSFSLSLVSKELAGCEIDEGLSLLVPRMVGREPRVSLAVDLPGTGAGVGALNADGRAVRWLRYSWAAGERGIEGGCGGISAPFWTSSSAMGKGIALALDRADRLVGVDPGEAGSAAARARNTAWVLRERSGTFTLARRAMP